MLMPLTSTWPLRSEGIGAGVGGSTSQRSVPLAGNKENKWGMNLLPEREFPDELRPGFRRRRDTPSPEKFDGLASFVAGRTIRGRESDNGETLPSFMCGSQSDPHRQVARAVRGRLRAGTDLGMVQLEGFE